MKPTNEERAIFLAAVCATAQVAKAEFGLTHKQATTLSVLVMDRIMPQFIERSEDCVEKYLASLIAYEAAVKEDLQAEAN